MIMKSPGRFCLAATALLFASTAFAEVNAAFVKPIAQRAGVSVSAAIPNLDEKRLVIAPIADDREGIVREELIAALATRASLAERQRIDLVFEEQKIQGSAVIDQKTASRLGKLIGGDTILYGRVRRWTEYPGIIRFDLVLTLTDVERGEVLWSDSFQRDWTSPKLWYVGGGLALVLAALMIVFVVWRRAKQRPFEIHATHSPLQDLSLSHADNALTRARNLEPRAQSNAGIAEALRGLITDLRTVRDKLRQLPEGNPNVQKEPALIRGAEIRGEAARKLQVMVAEIEDLAAQHDDGFQREAESALARLRSKAGNISADLASHPSALR